MVLPSGFSIRDVVDILIIAVLIYQGYVLLLGSRAWNVLRGVAALGGLWFIVTQFDLGTTRWLFDRIAPVTFIAIVIIFQPELRSALERVGQGRGNRKSGKDITQELISAVRELASQRLGAIIAIEQQTPLAEYGKNGSHVNTPVSSAMLQTIFGSKGPLHDGGVIIRDDEITHAGAIFPLSDKEGISIKYGTRHRAALGLSEASDALIIVVSEERGSVSLAKEGELISDIAPGEVLKALREVYGT